METIKKNPQTNEDSEMALNYRIQNRLSILLNHKSQMTNELRLPCQKLDNSLRVQYILFEKAFSNLIACEGEHLKKFNMEKLTLSELHTKLLNADSEINKTIIKKDIQQKENEIVKKLFLVLNDEELTITQATYDYLYSNVPKILSQKKG